MAISTANVDAGGDSPRLARAQIKETIDKVNELDAVANTLADYTALRAYTGVATSVRITGVLATAQPQGIAGQFIKDTTDTTSGALFTGSISGTTLTISSVTNGTVAIGQAVNRGDTGATVGYITAGSGLSWTLSASATVTSMTMTADNGGTVLVAANGVRWKRQFEGIPTVTMFGADRTGVAESTYQIIAAIKYIDTTEYEERSLGWPGGNYRVKNVDLTNLQYLTFVAQGTVQITGIDDTGTFIFGSNQYNAGSPASSTATRSFSMIGGLWLIGPASGELYTYGLCFEHFVSGTFNSVYVSGNYGQATASHRVSTRLQYSYVNRFTNCSFGSPGVPDTGYYSYSVCHGEPSGSVDNVNLNEYDTCRFVGVIGNTSATNTFCVKPAGYANSIINSDVSGAYYGIDLTNSAGGKFNVYLEGCQRLVTTGKGPGFAGGNTFDGGFFEVLQDGIAFELGLGGGSQNTVIIAPKVRGYSGATNRTFIDHGTGGATYGISVINPDCENIDTYHAGTYRGEGGFGSASGKVLQTAWLSFPATQVPSSDANTLDDYQEGSWTPTASNITGTNTYAGTYTKTGNRVDWEISITTSDTIGITGGTSTLTLPETTGKKNCCMAANQSSGIGYGTGLVTGNLAYPPTAAPAAGQAVTVSGSFRV